MTFDICCPNPFARFNNKFAIESELTSGQSFFHFAFYTECFSLSSISDLYLPFDLWQINWPFLRTNRKLRESFNCI